MLRTKHDIIRITSLSALHSKVHDLLIPGKEIETGVAPDASVCHIIVFHVDSQLDNFRHTTLDADYQVKSRLRLSQVILWV